MWGKDAAWRVIGLVAAHMELSCRPRVLVTLSWWPRVAGFELTMCGPRGKQFMGHGSFSAMVSKRACIHLLGSAASRSAVATGARGRWLGPLPSQSAQSWGAATLDAKGIWRSI